MIRRPRPRARLRLRAVVAALALAAGLPVALATSADAHGTVIDPPTRAYGCWKRWGDRFQDRAMAGLDPMCWQAWQADPSAMWNWNGLLRDGVGGRHQAAVPDGQLCSGGHTVGGRYAALDVPGPWKAAAVPNASAFTVTLHDQALHGADYLRFYVTRNGYDPLTQPLRWSDLVLLKDTGRIPRAVGAKSSDPILNGVSVSTALSAPGMTGRHVLFTIWQASHSDQSYYLCSDVVFGSSSAAGPATAPTTRPTAAPTTPQVGQPSASTAAAQRPPLITRSVAPGRSKAAAPSATSPATSAPADGTVTEVSEGSTGLPASLESPAPSKASDRGLTGGDPAVALAADASAGSGNSSSGGVPGWLLVAAAVAVALLIGGSRRLATRGEPR